ncbi:MAG: hypothetical protein A2Z96_01505 [Spirochaetes bacterium GWB1_48_6]|nr:MAG: hypothetical protein A2Z96_01505 [Spirochaetes bacterium GWB1_48_6]
MSKRNNTLLPLVFPIVLALGIPLVHLVSLVYLVVALWPPLALTGGFLLFGLTGIFFSWGKNSRRWGTRSQITFVLWETVGTFIWASIFLKPSRPEGLDYALGQFIPWIFLMFQGFSSHFWYSRLTGRYQLFSRLAGLWGKDLVVEKRKYQEDVGFSKIQRNSLFVSLCLMNSLVTLIPWILPSPLGKGIFLILLPLWVMDGLIFALLNWYRHEVDLFMWGLRYKGPVVIRMLGISLLLGSLSFAVVSLLPVEKLPFFNWGNASNLADLAPLPEKELLEGPPSPEKEQDSQDPEELAQGNGEMNFFLQILMGFFWFLQLLESQKYLVGGILFIFVLWWWFIPLVRGFKGFKIKLDFKLILLRVLTYFRNLWFWLTGRSARDLPPVFKLTNSEVFILHNPLPRKMKKEKHVNRRFLIKELFDILDWGGRLGVEYLPGETSGEYLEKLSLKQAAQKDSLMKIREIFNRGFFSEVRLTKADEEDFKKTVKLIVQGA